MPYSKKAKYTHHRQRKPSTFVKGTMKTVPLEHTEYEGRKFRKKGAKAVIGKIKKRGNGKGCRKYCWKIQSILIPKKKR